MDGKCIQLNVFSFSTGCGFEVDLWIQLNGCGGRTKKKYDITCRSEFLALQKNI